MHPIKEVTESEVLFIKIIYFNEILRAGFFFKRIMETKIKQGIINNVAIFYRHFLVIDY